MKYSSILMAFLFMLQAGALAQSKPSSKTEAGSPGCLDGSCSRPASKSMNRDEILALMRKMGLAKEVEAEKPVATSTSGAEAANDVAEKTPMAGAPMCRKFIDNDAIQSWGKLVAKAFNHEKKTPTSEIADKDGGAYKELYAGPRDIRLLCPKYESMDIEKKDAFWALLAAQWSFYESSCRPNAGLTQAQGAPNGTAYGLFALHLNHEQKYSAGCRKGDARDPERSIKCAFSMMNDKVKTGSDFFNEKGYWAVLQPSNTESKSGTGMRTPLYLMKLVCSYEHCGAKMTDCDKYISKFGPAASSNKLASGKRAKKLAKR